MYIITHNFNSIYFIYVGGIIMTKAWHLRQDGKAFPVQVHLYPMQDEDLSSEAEVAAFIIKTGSKGQGISKYVLDAWMAMLIENVVNYDADSDDILHCISEQLGKLPYKFAYPLSVAELLAIHESENNYNDIDTLYEFIDAVRDKLSDIQLEIKQVINQQFCRVRYGGKYNSTAGNTGIWFRVSSIGYNWANTIYIFTIENYRQLGIETITVCRDPESDHGFSASDDDYFYRAKDGAVYYNMPIEEFLQEEHEHSIVFSASSINSGVLAFIRSELSKGENLNRIYSSIRPNLLTNVSEAYSPNRVWKRFVREEESTQCICASEWSDNLNTRTGAKVGKIKRMINEEFPEIVVADVDCKPRANSKGNMVGFEMIFTLESEIEKLDHLQLSVVSSRGLQDVLAETVVRLFRIEYNDFVKFANIMV